MRLSIALILLALVLIVLAVAAAWIARRAEPLDYSADEIADAGDAYLAGMCSAVAASDRGAVGGGDSGACWPMGSCHGDQQ